MKTHPQTPFPPLIGMVILLILSSLKADVVQAAGPIARPGCNDTCGTVSIPFPWGIGAQRCFLDSWHEIKCKASPHSDSPKKPFLSKFKFNVEVLNISLLTDYYDYGAYVTVRIPPMNACTTADTHHRQPSSIDLRGGPYFFSPYNNIFVLEGCSGSAVLFNMSNISFGGCATICHSHNTTIKSDNCNGVKCCQSPLNEAIQFYHIDFNRQSSGGGINCLTGSLIDRNSLYDYVGKLSSSDRPSAEATVMLGWRWISNLKPDYNPHASCTSDDPYVSAEYYYMYNHTSTFCRCNEDSVGRNPYVSGGCQVPKVCEGCKGFCVQKQGNKYYCHPADRLSFLTSTIAIIVYIALSLALGPLLMVFGCRWLYYFTKRRRKAEKRVTFFKLMLQRHQSSNGVIENTKVFTHKELDKATDHFNDNRVLGKGGQGTVYKGMLVDGRIVAVKKSKRMDETQMEQFINEMVILSQINHRNVVKVLGCCLETEVPLLVYEFISNGTLYQHIHEHPDADFRLSWAMRLKIASDSAGAIAYLHSSSSTPVYHRDIKTSNILLDDKYRAKVSDFGSSKTIAIDQTHLTTLVQGTIGYLDPEYFESYIFTEKSDVYSFAVVLLELLTSKKPIYREETMEQKSLVTQFFFHLHNFCLSNILDPQVVKEAREEQLMAMVDLAKCCLNESGRLRPTMKEVAMTLEMIIKSPAETSSRDQQAFPDKGFTEFIMSEISDAEFMSSTIASDSASPLYIDVEPLLRDTI